MTAIALDDEWPALEVLDAFGQRLDGIQLVNTFTVPSEARQYLEVHAVDLLFLDINMPDETGLHFAHSIPPQTLVIFTTAYSEYALESYEVQAVDYLMKPFTFERFSLAVQRARNRLPIPKAPIAIESDRTEPAHVHFRVGYGLQKVMLNEILFIEGLDNYLKIHLLGGKGVVVRLTFNSLLNSLSSDNFVRVHRSYIVALDKVDALQTKQIRIGERDIPIGIHYEKDFLARFNP